MESTSFIDKLMELGLTRQESGIYHCILTEGKTTGYEVAKLTGISRSNTYNALANLQEKGCANVVEEGNVRRYIPVPLEEFCKNRMRKLEETCKWLLVRTPQVREEVDGYVTIEGRENILNKIKNLLEEATDSVYLSCTRNYLLLFMRELHTLMTKKRKVVIVTDRPVTFPNAKVYVGRDRKFEVGVIIDGKRVITGEYGEGSMNTCLYSGQKNFVEMYRRSLMNEMELLDMRMER